MPDPDHRAGLFPALLKHWRGQRGLSQLDLALAADVSARHVSFLETGRSRPSAEMVLRLATTLGMPLRQVNAMLRAAGHDPIYDESDDTLPPAVTEALSLLKAHQEPFPLIESHTNFPVLIQMRSVRPNQNWLLALLCVMDAAAMHISLNPELPQGSMRVAIRQGIVCLQELCKVEGIGFDEDPMPDKASAVSLEEFERACELIGTAGYTWERNPAEAYRHFRGWRANYEDMAYALAAEIDAVPAPWSGPRNPPLAVIEPDRQPNRTPDRPQGGAG